MGLEASGPDDAQPHFFEQRVGPHRSILVTSFPLCTVASLTIAFRITRVAFIVLQNIVLRNIVLRNIVLRNIGLVLSGWSAATETAWRGSCVGDGVASARVEMVRTFS